MKPVLVVFVKAPVIGGAKSRLASGVGRVEAWRLYRAMTAGVLRRLRDRRWSLVIAAAPDAAISRRFPGVWPDDLPRRPQGGGDLGARQARVFARRGPTIVIGSDAPQVSRDHLARAFRNLRRADAVIGPAQDGGYWLLGLNAPAPPGLFERIRWSHTATREDLEAQLRRFDRSRIVRLEMLRDIDEAADLHALRR